MALLDYKFVILIGLTLVIYFIYKELETMKTRIDKLENNSKNKKPLLVDNSIEKKSIEKIKDKINKIENNILLLKSDSIKNTTPPNSVISSSASPKKNNIVIDFTPTQNAITEIPKEHVRDLSPRLETPSVSNVPGKFSTSLLGSPTLLENVRERSSALSPRLETPSVSNVPEIVNDTNSKLSDSELSDSESDEAEPLAIYSNDNENFDENQNSLIESVKNLSTNNDNVQLEFHYDISINLDNIVDNKPTLTNNMLQEMKLPEIKKIAEENNIVLTKKVGNTTKPKIKKELIEEILHKNIT